MGRLDSSIPQHAVSQTIDVTWGNRSDSSLRGCCNFGVLGKPAFAPVQVCTSDPLGGNFLGGSLVTTEVRTEPAAMQVAGLDG